MVEYAEQHRISLHDLFVILGRQGVVGEDPQRRCIVPVGFRCVFSIEQQPDPVGWCRHLSVSVPEAGRAPNFEAIYLLATGLFGFRPFTTRDPNTMFLTEPIGPNHIAVNVLQRRERP